jgi:hypothetical protein
MSLSVSQVHWELAGQKREERHGALPSRDQPVTSRPNRLPSFWFAYRFSSATAHESDVPFRGT